MKHAITLTHCEPERAVGHQSDSDPNTGDFYCFACDTVGTFDVQLTATPPVVPTPET